jgi:phage terminase large subunit GpA-like protein
VVVSTPTIKGFSRIEMAFNESDQRRYYVPCVHCDQYQVLKWAQVQWPEGKPLEAAYFCELCGAEISDADKLAMVRGGEWRAESEFHGTAGFHINELYSPWRSFAEIACDFLEAKRNPELLRVWVNTALGETWEESGDIVEASPLYHRRERMENMPDGVKVLVAGADVQQDRIDVTLVGFGHKDEAWVYDHVQVFGDPATPGVWADLDRLLATPIEFADGRKIMPAVTCIDSGGHHTAEVYNYCRTRVARRVYAIKGMPGEGRALVTRPSRSNQGRVQLFPIGVHTGKDSLYARLKIKDAGPAYVHFSTRLDEEYFAQLTGEKMVTRYVKGRPTREYVKTRARNEALDCMVYALAARAITNINLHEDEKPAGPAVAQRPKQSFVNGWKERGRGWGL